ncbi:hypothetical protein [Salinigranum marinum]|uniref:hypothetical protein n=1 Tax=Salinigranum marinum TaxID=1515595 RepID=UPI002989EA3A|nr:hypothetical protein [Salinigranum marinum]
MRRRSVLRALVGTTGTSALAGCNALSGGDADSTASPSGRGGSARGTGSSGTDRAEASGSPRTSSPGPYRASDGPPLDRPRGLHVRNLGSTDQFLTAVVTAGAGGDGTEILVDSVAVPSGETVSFRGLIATEGRYGVLVEPADGARRRYDWELGRAFGDLWVDLTPDVSFSRPVLCGPDCPFATAGGERTVAYEIPPDLAVSDALGATPALAVDNDTGGRSRARLHVWNQGRLRFASGYHLPADVRLVVPVFPASRRYNVVLRTAEGEAIYDWQPSVRNTLYASLTDGPSFRCGYADHDVHVRNETDAPRTVTVRVSTGAETLFEGTFDVDANAVETVPAAVDPAGPFRFVVETDGTTERYNWVWCAPNGPITVAVSDDGVSVSVQPTRGSA